MVYWLVFVKIILFIIFFVIKWIEETVKCRIDMGGGMDQLVRALSY